MPMTKKDKQAVVDEIAQTLDDHTIVYLTDYSGLTVEQANELRNRFRDSGVTYKVYKNTLIRRAMEKLGGFEDLYDQLHGPTAVAYCEEPAAPARVIKTFTKEAAVDRPELKAALVDGDFYAADTLDVLASLKSKDELIGDILALLAAPIKNVVGAIQAPGRNLAGAIQTIAEKE
ncbi:MAG: 50S ribosomal protein L10 [Rhodothermales bacterium]